MQSTHISSRLGAAIKESRRLNYMGQGTVAERAGISQSELSRIENGLSCGTVPTLVRIAAALGTTLARLCTRAGI